MKIELTQTEMKKNPNTKTSYIVTGKTVKDITEEQHRLITNQETCKWFRRLGGSESKTMGYTFAGYKCIKLISTSPDRNKKKIRQFKFIYSPAFAR